MVFGLPSPHKHGDSNMSVQVGQGLSQMILLFVKPSLIPGVRGMLFGCD